MPSRLRATGFRERTLEKPLGEAVRSARPSALGIAVAYISIYGATYAKRLIQASTVAKVRIVADIGDAITHPEALRVALAEGWETRVVHRPSGTFHPKMVIGGRAFNREDLEDARLLVLGSANLTRGGLRTNIECSFIRVSDEHIQPASRVFAELWSLGEDLSETGLAAYEVEFLRRNRHRSPQDMRALGVADVFDPPPTALPEVRARRPPPSNERSVSTVAAEAAWAGLESFTGEYRFQLEFPRDAGVVLRRIIRNLGGDAPIQVRCEDGHIRPMTYGYYEDNAMFRLNVPNDTPGVAWARANHSGIAVLETREGEDAQLYFRVLPPGAESMVIIARSVALGTWGKTPTRLYGWY